MWDTIVDRGYVSICYFCACNAMKQGLFMTGQKKYFWLTARVEFELARIEFNLVKVSKVNTATSKMEIN